jgi:hypothetical protein
MRFFAIALYLLMTPAHAESAYFMNYGQWEQLPTHLRWIYVAGAFDALSVVTAPQTLNSVIHYNRCVVKAGLSTQQLADNMKAYAEPQSDLQDKPVPIVLMYYLISLCGRPPDAVGE